MRIGVIGTGNMGRSLGIVWAEAGHQVFFGSRDQEKAKLAAELAPGRNAQFGSNEEAARFGEVLLFTPRGVPPAEVLGPQGPDSLAGKIVIDMNNQEIPGGFAFPPVIKSLAEILSEQAPGAKVVKAFNTMPMEVFELCPEAIRPYRVAAFVASDDESARAVVLRLAGEIGFVPVDAGNLQQARLLEAAGDMIRLLLIRQKMAGANFSLVTVPPVEHPRLGGRRQSALK